MAFETPTTELEKAMTKIWSKVLGNDRIGIQDNFFELGGKSINVFDIIGECAELGIDVPIELFLEKPTIRAICKTLTANEVQQKISDAQVSS